MNKKEKPKMEYRYYDMPPGSPVMVLLGQKWKQNYGHDIDYLHFHNYLEIGYCYCGEGTLTIKDRDNAFHGGMFSVIPKDIPHTTNTKADTYSQWEYIFIDTDSILKELFCKNVLWKKESIKRINQVWHFCGVEENRPVSDLILSILRVMREQKALYMEEVKGLLTALLIELVRWNETDTDTEYSESEFFTGGVESILYKSLDYVGSHYDRPLKVQDIAKECHISETHFRRLFTEHIKMTPVEYINKVRVEMACSDLKNTNLSVSSIAVKNGFQNISTFNRNFKKLMKETPKQWRNNLDIYERKSVNYKIKTNEGW